MPGKSTAMFKLEPVEGGTNVTWSSNWKNNFMAKAVSLVIDCEAMTGGYFEQGLENLRAQVEK